MNCGRRRRTARPLLAMVAMPPRAAATPGDRQGHDGHSIGSRTADRLEGGMSSSGSTRRPEPQPAEADAAAPGTTQMARSPAGLPRS